MHFDVKNEFITLKEENYATFKNISAIPHNHDHDGTYITLNHSDINRLNCSEPQYTPGYIYTTRRIILLHNNFIFFIVNLLINESLMDDLIKSINEFCLYSSHINSLL